MYLCEQKVEAHMQRALAISVTVGVAPFPLPADLGLTTQEQQRYDKLRGTPRASSWLAGRAALKRVLSQLGESTDTSELAFPHARVSLTHSGRYAVALGVPKNVGIVGVGIDLEMNKSLNPQGDRFFLTPAEWAWVRSCPVQYQAGERLRLWTVKEALFKAQPHNSEAMLFDYHVETPSAHTGTGINHKTCAVRFSYSSLSLAEGILSVAISQPREVYS